MTQWDDLHYRVDDGFGLPHPLLPDDIIVVHQCGPRLRRGTALICSGACRGYAPEFRITVAEYDRRNAVTE
jgi:hypothetical protein